MSNKVKLWFTNSFNLGRSVQEKEHNHCSVDGQAVWRKLESNLSSLGELKDDDDRDLKYNRSLIEIYSRMDRIIEKFNMAEYELCPKSNHFFMQLKNLVDKKSNFNIKMNRVAQLGFNAGQLSVFIDRGTLLDDRKKMVTDFVNEHKLFDIDTYINPDIQVFISSKYLDDEKYDISNISDYEDSKQSGGDMLSRKTLCRKYMKYKLKYKYK